MVKPSRRNFVDNLDFWLWYKRMSQDELARKLGATASQVSLWKKRFPQPEQLDRIANALGITVAHLLYDPTDPLSTDSLLWALVEDGSDDNLEEARSLALREYIDFQRQRGASDGKLAELLRAVEGKPVAIHPRDLEEARAIRASYIASKRTGLDEKVKKARKKAATKKKR